MSKHMRRLLHFCSALALTLPLSVVAIAPAHAQAQKRNFDIPAQPLSSALIEFSRQSGELVVVSPDAVKSRRAPAVKGSLRASDALARLISGTGLSATQKEGGGFVLTPRSAAGSGGPANETAEEVSAEAAEIVVTGTLIKGVAPAGAPVTIYNRKKIEQTGATTTEQFVRTLTNNLSDVDGSRTSLGSVFLPTSGSNVANGTALNLRGIGSGATLSLINGHRLPGSGSDGSVVDISLIPLSALSRVEVLTDGASAIYGSDAVAGVVNFVTRKDYDGAETTLSFGDTTQGGAQEYGASQLFGKSWGSGGLLLNYEHYNAEPLFIQQRKWGNPGSFGSTLAPSQRRNSVFASLRQDVGASVHLDGDFIYSRRSTANQQGFFLDDGTGVLTPAVQTFNGRTTLAGGTVSAAVDLSPKWTIKATGQYNVAKTFVANENPTFFVSGQGRSKSSILIGEALLSGALFPLGGSDAKISIGGQYRKEHFVDDSTLTTNIGDLRRNLYSVYGEINLPFVTPASELSFAHRLEVSLAARYDHYSDFGGGFSPKAGISWFPAAKLGFRASYGRSFRAPPLANLSTTNNSEFAIPFASNSPTGLTPTIILNGNNPIVGRERSKAFTAGADFFFDRDKTGGIHVTYYNINYTDRIASPPFAPDILLNAAYAPLVNLRPTAAQIQAIYASPTFQNFRNIPASAIGAIFDGRNANLAATRNSGIDVAFDKYFPAGSGRFSIDGSVTYIIKNSVQAVRGAPAVSQLNQVYAPIDLRVRGGLGWSNDNWSTGLTLNYVDGYGDPFDPTVRINPFGTIDLQLGYTSTAEAGLMKGLSLRLNVQNLADSDPPRVPIQSPDFSPGYDPVNASALGRFISVSLTKKW